MTDAATGQHRQQAVDANNRAWELIESPALKAADFPTLMTAAVSAQWHWKRADPDPLSVRHLRALHLMVFALVRTGRRVEAAELAGQIAAAHERVSSGVTQFDRAMTLACQVRTGVHPGSALQAVMASLEADERRLITTLLAQP